MDIYIICWLFVFTIFWVCALILFKDSRSEFMTGSVLMGFIINFIFYSVYTSEPSALDVYRGKTTLKITSVNGVPQDTVVIYIKNK